MWCIGIQIPGDQSVLQIFIIKKEMTKSADPVEKAFSQLNIKERVRRRNVNERLKENGERALWAMSSGQTVGRGIKWNARKVDRA